MRIDSGVWQGCPTPILLSHDLGYIHNGWSLSSHFYKEVSLGLEDSAAQTEKRGFFKTLWSPCTSPRLACIQFLRHKEK